MIDYGMPVLSFTISDDKLQAGAIGVRADTFEVVIPGAEWRLVSDILATDTADLGPVLGYINPLVWVVGDPSQGFEVKLIPGPPPFVGIRIVGPDLVTPLPGAYFACGARLYRYGPTS